jgi:Cu+-exporting ATPase
MAIDPVCKMTVDPQKAAAKVILRGGTYYFCSSGCHKEFTAHPEKYLTEMPDKGHGEHEPGA